jgi:hypothetical protein
MTIQVELSSEAEARLKAAAVVRGVALEAYAGQLLQLILAPQTPGTGVLTPEDVETTTKLLTEDSASLPVLPPEATERSSYYEDRM